MTRVRSWFAMVLVGGAMSLLACGPASSGDAGAEVNTLGPCGPIAAPCGGSVPCCVGLVCCPAASSGTQPFCASECNRP